MSTLTEDREFPTPKPQSAEREKVRNRLSARIEELRQLHRSSHPFFRNRTIIEYIEDSQKRFAEHKERPAYKQAWQSNLANPAYRDKLIAILSKLASQAMEAQVIGTAELTPISQKKERVLSLLLKSVNIKNNDDFALINEMLEAMVKGTVVGFESWRFGEREVRDVVAYNNDGSITTKSRTIKDWDDVWGTIWPLENVYFGDIYVNDVQDMPDVALRRVVKWDSFQKEFGDFEDADKVLPAGTITGSDEDDTIFTVSTDLDDDEVEIFYYFNKDDDEYLIVANDIWINPLGEAGIQPMIWSHKKLPIWTAVFEPLDAKFIYGKSLPDKFIATGDTQDKLLDNILDRLTLVLNAPLVAPDGTTSLTENFLSPQNVITYPIGTTQLPQTLDIKEPSAISQNIYNLLQQRLEASSVSAEVSGGGGTGKKTATQVNIENQATLDLISLFLKMMEFGIRDKNRLRLPNTMQFYTFPIHASDKKNRFKRIVLRNEKTSSGEMGTVELGIVSKINQAKLEQEAQMLSTETNRVEKIEITPKFIRDPQDADINIVANSSVKMSKPLRQAMELNFQTVMNNLYPDKFNRDAGYKDMLLTFDKDVDKYLSDLKGVGDLGSQTPQQIPQLADQITRGQKPNLNLNALV